MAKTTKTKKDQTKPEKKEKLPTKRRVIGYLVYLSCLAIVAFAFLAQMGFLGIGGDEINNPNFQTTQNTPAVNLSDNQIEQPTGLPETNTELFAPNIVQTENISTAQPFSETRNKNIAQDTESQLSESTMEQQFNIELPNSPQSVTPQQPLPVEDEQTPIEMPYSSSDTPQSDTARYTELQNAQDLIIKTNSTQEENTT